MARAKKVVKGRKSEEEQKTIAVAPKRNLRKRKAVNYAEPQLDDPDWIEEKPVKKTKKPVRQSESDSEEEQAPAPRRKPQPKKKAVPVQAYDDGEEEAVAPIPKPQQKQKSRKGRDDEIEFDEDGEEVRKRDYQHDPPEHFEGKLARALYQPIAITSRERTDSEDYPSETFEMMGSDGEKHYTVEIKLVPKCSCPDFIFRRKMCKHILYVLTKALKVPKDSHLLYQQALTSSELHEILTDETAAPVAAPEDLERDGKRKPIDGECPVCYMDFEPQEEITYCKAQCGNNIHGACMRTWIASETRAYGKATCPLCRKDWAE